VFQYGPDNPRAQSIQRYAGDAIQTGFFGFNQYRADRTPDPCVGLTLAATIHLASYLVHRYKVQAAAPALDWPPVRAPATWHTHSEMNLSAQGAMLE